MTLFQPDELPTYTCKTRMLSPAQQGKDLRGGEVGTLCCLGGVRGDEKFDKIATPLVSAYLLKLDNSSFFLPYK